MADTETISASSGSDFGRPAEVVKDTPASVQASHAKVGAALAEFASTHDNAGNEIEPAEDGGVEAEVVEAPEAAEDAAPDPKPPQEEASAEESEQVEESAAPAEKPSVPTIPAALRRSLKASEWTDEEIDEAARVNYDALLRTAERVHKHRTSEVADWAARGRAAKQAGLQAAEQPRQPAPKAPTTFQGLDTEMLKEKYGEGVVADIVAPVNAMIEKINAVMPSLESVTQSHAQARLDSLTKEIEGFFNGSDLKDFADVYGTGDKVSDDQYKKRNEVLEYADALTFGAHQQGKRLTVSEALTLAHDIVGSKHKTNAVRKEITTKITKRASGLTIKPGQTPGKDSTKAPQNRSELEVRTRARLAGVFGH